MGETLGTIAASLILLSGILLVIGVVLIKRGNRVWHPRVMLAAATLAVLFLVFYLLKWGLYGTSYYRGPAEWKEAYLALLAGHILLAAANVPLATYVIYNALRGRFERHKRWARITVPVWLFVALSGWVIGLVLRRYGAES